MFSLFQIVHDMSIACVAAYRRFKPGWVPTLVVLVVLGLMLQLGFWQLDRAAEKRAMLSAHETHRALPPADLEQLDPGDPRSRYRAVVGHGVYDHRRQFLLDNQVERGQAGYHVYTPFLPDNADTAVLVNRGWVAWGESRARLPDIRIDDPVVTISGRIDQPANPAIRLGDAFAQSGWPKVVPYMDYQQLSEVLGYPLIPAIILLDADRPQGFHREWQLDFGGLGPERHDAYAVQWFAMSTALLVLYGIFGWRRAHVTETRGPH